MDQKARILPKRLRELQRYLKEAMIPLLQTMGFVCEILDNPVDAGIPFLFAERMENPDFETILVYGHGDVIRAQTGQWREGIGTIRNWSIEGDKAYGRGTADNKGQHLINFAALRTVIETRGALGFNCKVMTGDGRGVRLARPRPNSLPLTKTSSNPTS